MTTWTRGNKAECYEHIFKVFFNLEDDEPLMHVYDKPSQDFDYIVSDTFHEMSKLEYATVDDTGNKTMAPLPRVYYRQLQCLKAWSVVTKAKGTFPGRDIAKWKAITYDDFIDFCHSPDCIALMEDPSLFASYKSPTAVAASTKPTYESSNKFTEPSAIITDSIQETTTVVSFDQNKADIINTENGIEEVDDDMESMDGDDRNVITPVADDLEVKNLLQGISECSKDTELHGVCTDFAKLDSFLEKLLEDGEKNVADFSIQSCDSRNVPVTECVITESRHVLAISGQLDPGEKKIPSSNQQDVPIQNLEHQKTRQTEGFVHRKPSMIVQYQELEACRAEYLATMKRIEKMISNDDRNRSQKIVTSLNGEIGAVQCSTSASDFNDFQSYLSDNDPSMTVSQFTTQGSLVNDDSSQGIGVHGDSSRVQLEDQDFMHPTKPVSMEPFTRFSDVSSDLSTSAQDQLKACGASSAATTPEQSYSNYLALLKSTAIGHDKKHGKFDTAKTRQEVYQAEFFEYHTGDGGFGDGFDDDDPHNTDTHVSELMQVSQADIKTFVPMTMCKAVMEPSSEVDTSGQPDDDPHGSTATTEESTDIEEDLLNDVANFKAFMKNLKPPEPRFQTSYMKKADHGNCYKKVGIALHIPQLNILSDLRLDPLDGEIVREFVKSVTEEQFRIDQVDKSSDSNTTAPLQEPQAVNSLPVFQVEDLTGPTFLMDENYKGKVHKHPGHTENSYDKRVITYNKLRDKEDDTIWKKFKSIFGHVVVPLKLGDDPPYKGSCYKVMVKRENGEITEDCPLTIIVYSGEKLTCLAMENGEITEDCPLAIFVYSGEELTHLAMGRLMTSAIQHLLNGTPMDCCFMKKHSTLEAATFGSKEFGVAIRTAVEQIMELHLTLRYLGVPIRDKTYMFGDNKTVVDSATLPHGKLHKRHIMLSYHQVREAIASGMVVFTFLEGKYNPADILSKHWGYHSVWKSLRTLLFHSGETELAYDDEEDGETKPDSPQSSD